MSTIRQLTETTSGDESIADTSTKVPGKFLTPIVLGLFIVWTVDFVIKFALDKHFSLDGVNYFFHILQNEGFANIAWSRRYTEYLTEWPLVLSLELGLSDIPLLSKIFGLGIYFPYLLSFGLCWLITDRGDRALLLFPLASFVGFNLLSDYDVIADHHVLAVMTWPIMLLLIKHRPLEWQEGLLLWILVFAYSRMYETAVLNAFLFSLILITRMSCFKVRREMIICGVGLALFAVVLYISIQYIVSPRSPTNRGAFLDSILVNQRNWEAVATNSFLGIFFLGWLIRDRWDLVKNIVFGLALVPIVAYVLARFMHPDYAVTAYLSFSSRTLVAIVVPGLLIACALIGALRSRLTLIGLASFTLMFVVMVGFNLYDLRHWNEVKKEFVELSSSEQMFINIEETALADPSLELRHHRWSWNNPLLSLVWSGGCVRTVVLNSEQGPQGPFDPRKQLVLKRYLEYDERFRDIDTGVRTCSKKG